MSKVRKELFEELQNESIQKSTGFEQAKNGFNQYMNAFGQAPLVLRLVTLATNVLFVTGAYVSTSSQKQISDRFIVYTQPPGLFFSIWGVIFLAAGIVNLINVFVKDKLCTVAFCLLINCAHFSGFLWTCIFALGTKNAVNISCIALISFAICLFLAWIQLGRAANIKKQNDKKNLFKLYIFRNVIAFWLGWVIAAVNLGIGIVLVYGLEVSNLTQVLVFWILAPFCAVLMTIFSYWSQGKRGIKSCFCLWISVVWALVGAAISTVNNL